MSSGLSLLKIMVNRLLFVVRSNVSSYLIHQSDCLRNRFCLFLYGMSYAIELRQYYGILKRRLSEVSVWCGPPALAQNTVMFEAIIDPLCFA